MTMAYALLICRWWIGLTFAVSAYGKLRNVAAFRESISALGVLPVSRNAGAAWAVISLETVVVILMLVWPSPGFGLAGILLVAFSLVIGQALRRGVRASCNCFGAGRRPAAWTDVGRNLLLGLGAAAGLWWSARLDVGSFAPNLVVLAGLQAACLTALVVNLDQVVRVMVRPLPIE